MADVTNLVQSVDQVDKLASGDGGGDIIVGGSGVYDDSYSINGVKADQITDMRGVIDYGNLMQFAPYESGYSFIAVINGPAFGKSGGGAPESFVELQKSFIKIIENEFRGLDGIDDITSDTMEITDNITSMSLISKVNQTTNSQLSMRFFEKTGATITKYIADYLRYIRDPKTQAKTYGGAIKANWTRDQYGPHKEVFNMLYIVTDATCLHVEKAFLLLNAQPTTASFGELYNTEKGAIENKEVTVTWNCFVVDGKLVNQAAATYLAYMVNNGANQAGKININSWDFDWSISDGTGTTKSITQVKLDNDANSAEYGKLKFE